MFSKDETGTASLSPRSMFALPGLPFLRKHREKNENESGIGKLPEDCIAHILSLTSPRDASVSSLVSSIFKSAADSDDIWNKFLPPLDFKPILPNHLSSSKKQFYSRLCAGPVLLDGGNKSISIDKSSGKVWFMIGSKELTISWDDTIYNWDCEEGRAFLATLWKLIPSSHSRFAESIELVERDWHQISGKIETRMLSPETIYGAYLVFKLTDYAFGFGCDGERHNEIDYAYVDISVEFIRGEGRASGSDSNNIKYLLKPRPNGKYASNRYRCHFPNDEMEGGWLELKIGTFYTGQVNDGGEVEFFLRGQEADDYKANMWMNGIIIQGIELRPKNNNKARLDLFND